MNKEVPLEEKIDKVFESSYVNGIKYINFIDRLKLLFIKPMYLYNKEYNFTIKYKINKGKIYILKEIWGDSNE